MRLYKQMDKWEQIAHDLDEAGGEVTPEIAELIGDFENEVAGALNDLVTHIRGEEADISQCKAEIERLKGVIADKQRGIDNLSAHAVVNLNRMRRKKVDTGIYKITVAKTPESLVVDDLGVIDDRFKVAELKMPATQVPEELRYLAKCTALKSVIKTALKDGEAIDGVHLESSEKLRIQ